MRSILRAASLLAFALVAALWVRSHFVFNYVNYDGAVGARSCVDVQLLSYTGYFGVALGRYEFPAEERRAFIGHHAGRPDAFVVRDVHRYRSEAEYDLHRRNFDLGWFYYGTRREAGMWRIQGSALVQRNVRAPYWLLAIALLIYPVCSGLARVRARRRKKLSARGMCAECGYDLRASPERCPECGSSVASANPPERAPAQSA